MSAEPIDLDAAQALADAATPGPWESDGDYDRAEVCQTVEPFVTIVGTETEGRAYMSYERLVLSAADSAFIAQARTLVPALIAELRETRAERDGYKARGRVYEGKVQTLRDDIRAALAEYDVSPTLADFNAALEGGA
ncbi:hypothetical protein [Rhodococcus opacus]|uniref:hypothetical protein n=1 Tax=Rhodococcus opacus TaxID=37919 RepID=UPI001C4421D0|nr:hypothetical protein [Rhodococcus opacus]MBV6758398.1 hypothetical protein [Rhodococcus opacus]